MTGGFLMVVRLSQVAWDWDVTLADTEFIIEEHGIAAGGNIVAAT